MRRAFRIPWGNHVKTCPYCAMPMTNARRVQCGAVDCKRKFNADRMREYLREKRAQDGESYGTRDATCQVCGDTFRTKTKSTRCCSRHCTNIMRYGGTLEQRRAKAERLAKRAALQELQRQAAQGTASTWTWVVGTCSDCGNYFTRHGQASTYCSTKCRRRADKRARRAGDRRARVSRFTIHTRDAWTCHICGDPVNRLSVVPELDAPTLDHVIPIAAGGSHTADNLKTAHFYCNSYKRDISLSALA